MKKKSQKKSIGKMIHSRMVWRINPVTRVKKNKKGKGSYNRRKEKVVYWE